MEQSVVPPTTVASLIYQGFVDYRRAFSEVTAGAQTRFTEQNWQGVQDKSRERIRLYKQCKFLVCESLAQGSPASATSEIDWPGTRSEFARLVSGRRDAVLAGTFFNTIHRALMPELLLSEENAFIEHDPIETHDQAAALTRKLRGNHLLPLMTELLQCNELSASMSDIERDARLVTDRLKLEIPLLRAPGAILVEFVTVNFYRNKGAYLVGRLVVDGNLFPITIAFCVGQQSKDQEGVYVDAVLWGEPRLSIVFSFTRSYFMVMTEEPTQLVNYLQTLLPEKRRWELFTSIGFFKHGKTEFIRDLRRDLRFSDDLFEISEGIKGQIMLVFGLSSFKTVFKVMRDRFPATKNIDHEGVRAAYRLVKTHDRVGRMADTHEFRNLTLPLDRFSEEVLSALQSSAPGQIVISGSEVVIKHLYSERMMVPLNLYVKRCTDFQLQAVINDYGAAIRELAAANIFPGDMLLKNFGVTRHGRVVFYDYDEICYLTEVNFRDMPARDGASQSVSADAWFDVGEFDVFPEEFSRFLFPDENMRNLFSENHGDLFTAAGWQAIQAQVEQSMMVDVFPYPLREQFS